MFLCLLIAVYCMGLSREAGERELREFLDNPIMSELRGLKECLEALRERPFDVIALGQALSYASNIHRHLGEYERMRSEKEKLVMG